MLVVLVPTEPQEALQHVDKPGGLRLLPAEASKAEETIQDMIMIVEASKPKELDPRILLILKPPCGSEI